MGATQSSVSEVITNVSTQILNTNAQNCALSTNVNQALTISQLSALGNININGVNQTSNVNLDFSCMSNSNNNIQLQSDLTNAIKTALDQKTEALSSLSNQNSINTAKDNVMNSLNIQNILSCVVNSYSNISLTITQLNAGKDIDIKDINQSTTSAVISKCIANNQNLTNAINTLQNTLDTSNKQTALGLFSSGGTGLVLIVVIIICLLSSSSSGILFIE